MRQRLCEKMATMRSHPAAHVHQRQRRAVVAFAVLLLVAGVAVAIAATGTLLAPDSPADSTVEEPQRLPVPPASALVTDPVSHETAQTASGPVEPEQTVPPPAPQARAPAAASPPSPAAPLPGPPAATTKEEPPYGRFTLFGDADAAPERAFGESVAIAGDVAVAGAPGFEQRGFRCGAAYVFERREGVWTQTQRLDAPLPTRQGFARRVAVVAGAIVVLDVDLFRTYVAGNGAWRQAGETQLPSPMLSDAVARGDTLAVGVKGAVMLFRRVGAEWGDRTLVAAPADRRARFGNWLSLDGDSLAVLSYDSRSVGAGVATFVFRRDGRTFGRAPVATLTLARANHVDGALALRGTALLQASEEGTLTIDEQSQAGWTRTTARGLRRGSFSPLHGANGMAGDGSLVVAVEVEPASFAVFEHRDDGWYRTAVAAPDVPRGIGEAIWHPHIALSGRTVVAATSWDARNSGRAWIFDITDDDLARAARIEPVTR